MYLASFASESSQSPGKPYHLAIGRMLGKHYSAPKPIIDSAAVMI